MGIGLGVAEFAATRAGITHEHDRRRGDSVLASPALANVRALGFLAHRCQFQLAHLPVSRPERK